MCYLWYCTIYPPRLDFTDPFLHVYSFLLTKPMYKPYFACGGCFVTKIRGCAIYGLVLSIRFSLYVRMRIENVTVDKSYVRMRIENVTVDKSYFVFVYLLIHWFPIKRSNLILKIMLMYFCYTNIFGYLGRRHLLKHITFYLSVISFRESGWANQVPGEAGPHIDLNIDRFSNNMCYFTY